MTKSIDQLVSDIEELFKGRDLRSTIDDFSKDLGLMLVNRFKEHAEVQPKFSLRISNIGVPLRKLYYDQKFPSKSAPPSMRFLFGDLCELLLLYLAREAGHTVEREQEEVILDGVKGHLDAVIDGVVVDVKSCSPKAFQKFKDGSLISDDPFGYLQQLAGYSTALGGLDGAFLAINKVSGEICLLKFSGEELRMFNARETIRKAREVLNQPDPPERCYSLKTEKNGNLSLPIGCVFCNHKQECYKDANDGQGLRAFQYSYGIQYLASVKKKPKVEEVT